MNRDTLYEIAVLFKIIEIAIKCGWQETCVGLIGRSSKTVCTLESDGRILKVFYQKLPEAFAKNSKYGVLMSKYGLSDKLRRPDIVLLLEEGESTIYYIVEVKRSARRSYLVDGVYKLFGYLKDFESICNEGQSIKGILIGWKGILPVPYDSRREAHIFTWENIEEGLAIVLESHCENWGYA